MIDLVPLLTTLHALVFINVLADIDGALTNMLRALPGWRPVLLASRVERHTEVDRADAGSNSSGVSTRCRRTKKAQ